MSKIPTKPRLVCGVRCRVPRNVNFLGMVYHMRCRFPHRDDTVYEHTVVDLGVDDRDIRWGIERKVLSGACGNEVVGRSGTSRSHLIGIARRHYDHPDALYTIKKAPAGVVLTVEGLR